MGRSAEGWKLKTDPRTGIQSVRFRHNGIRYDRSTGERDPAKVREEAARIYARIVSGKTVPRVTGSARLPLTELFASFVLSMEGEVTPGTLRNYSFCLFSILEPSFRSLDRFTTPIIAEHFRSRLKVVLRASLAMDALLLRRFFAWCVSKGLMTEGSLPVVPKLPKGARGTRAVNRKEKAIPISKAEANAILAALPERSGRGGFPVRARFAVQWETSLRQATIGRLRVPEHYRKGSATLIITDPIDKARFGRELPLTDAARAALDSVCPDVGLIFGERRCDAYRRYIARAAVAAKLPPEKVKAFSPYDLRHGRITDLLAAGAPLPAVAFLAGHTLLTTTNMYVQIAQAGQVAADALRNSGGISGGESAVTPIKKRRTAR